MFFLLLIKNKLCLQKYLFKHYNLIHIGIFEHI